jgi:hypothetical protein
MNCIFDVIRTCPFGLSTGLIGLLHDELDGSMYFFSNKSFIVFWLLFALHGEFSIFYIHFFVWDCVNFAQYFRKP